MKKLMGRILHAINACNFLTKNFVGYDRITKCAIYRCWVCGNYYRVTRVEALIGTKYEFMETLMMPEELDLEEPNVLSR